MDLLQEIPQGLISDESVINAWNSVDQVNSKCKIKRQKIFSVLVVIFHDAYGVKRESISVQTEMCTALLTPLPAVVFHSYLIKCPITVNL